MITQEQAEVYYNHYINNILKMYIKNYGSITWKTPQELILQEIPTRIPWNLKISDNFIINSADDKTKIGKDILDRGMFWPFFTVNDAVILGYHRLYSLQQLDTDKKFMCVEINKNHYTASEGHRGIIGIGGNTPLPYSFYAEVPKYFTPPIDAGPYEYLVLRNDKIIKNEDFIVVKIKTYRDLMDLLRITPHWIKNYLYDYNISPNNIINSEEIFSEWIKK